MERAVSRTSAGGPGTSAGPARTAALLLHLLHILANLGELGGADKSVVIRIHRVEEFLHAFGNFVFAEFSVTVLIQRLHIERRTTGALLSFAGLSLAKDIPAFRRLGWRIVVVSLLANAGVFLAATAIAQFFVGSL